MVNVNVFGSVGWGIDKCVGAGVGRGCSDEVYSDDGYKVVEGDEL